MNRLSVSFFDEMRSFLTITEMHKCRRVSKVWLNIDTVKKKKFDTTSTSAQAAVESNPSPLLGANFLNLEKLDFGKCGPSGALLQHILTQAQSTLKYLSVWSGFPWTNIPMLPKCKKLVIMPNSTSDLINLLRSTPNLQSLSVHAIFFRRMDQSAHNIPELSNLRKLSMNLFWPPFDITDSLIRKAPNITHLEIDNHSVDTTTLTIDFKQIQQLKYLKIPKFEALGYINHDYAKMKTIRCGEEIGLDDLQNHGLKFFRDFPEAKMYFHFCEHGPQLNCSSDPDFIHMEFRIAPTTMKLKDLELQERHQSFAADLKRAILLIRGIRKIKRTNIDEDLDSITFTKIVSLLAETKLYSRLELASLCRNLIQ